MKSAVFNPPYCQVLIEDVGGGEPPPVVESSLVVATGSCIAVTCGYDFDVQFTMGKLEEVEPGGHSNFSGIITTPNLILAIRTAELETILEEPVPRESTTVHVWVRDSETEEKVIFGFE